MAELTLGGADVLNMEILLGRFGWGGMSPAPLIISRQNFHAYIPTTVLLSRKSIELKFQVLFARGEVKINCSQARILEPISKLKPISQLKSILLEVKLYNYLRL